MATSSDFATAGHDTQLKRIADLAPDMSAGISSHEQLGAATGARIAGGVVYWKDIEYSWTLLYDEIIFCHAVEGRFEIEIDGVPRVMSPGDMIWLPEGQAVIYRAVGEATVFYAVTPTDWAARLPADMQGAG